MRATIQELVHAPQTDYVEAFQAISHVNMEIQKMGPTPERLLRRAVLEIDMGSYVDARESIQDSLLAGHQAPEAMYYLGIVNVFLAMQKAGAIAAAAGQFAPEPARVHMEQACAAFRSALALNEDEDLQAQLEACEDLLEEAPDEDAFVALFDPDFV
ncbi:MAG: hypothetical protein ACPHK8_00855 [Thermoplasmatota archaeon]